jgi:hypothetical protein
MLSVTNKSIMLNDVMLSVVKLNVIMLSVMAPNNSLLAIARYNLLSKDIQCQFYIKKFFISDEGSK